MQYNENVSQISYFRQISQIMKTGDLVSVIDDNLRGTITNIKEKKVTIVDEHGFEYVYNASELVVQEATIYNEMQTVMKKERSKPTSKKHDKKPFILDLHFETLVKKTTDYDSFERLFLQKQKLLQTLDYCRKNNLKKLEIIHGIGDGVLQSMVFEVLESQTHLEFHNKEILHHQSGTVLVYFR